MIHSNFLHQNLIIKSFILPSILFDHNPISLHIQDTPNYGPLPFHFNPLWLNYEEVNSLVESTSQTWIPGTLVYIWEKNLILVKQSLKLWDKVSFNPPNKEKEVIKGKLEKLQ
jgi:hypothetical protein